MLETDLQLKKDTARFTSPETAEGREYWDKLYKKAGEIFGSENITIPTLTRPWIVPDEIIIRETTDSAYIYKATLKVMLEQDYLKGSAVYNFKDDRLKGLNEYSSQLIREIIIPKLTKEVNSSKRYASLRQVYYSLIMAQWFKARYYGKDGLYSHLIDRRDLTGLTSKESWSKTTYFQAYQKSFKDGEYNIQEPIYTPYGQTIRTYFSGGELLQIPHMPPFGSEIATDTGGRITSSPARTEISKVLRKGQAFLLSVLVFAGVAVNSATPAEFAIRVQAESSTELTVSMDSDTTGASRKTIKDLTAQIRKILEDMFIKRGGRVVVIKDKEWKEFSKKHGYDCPISGLADPEKKIIYIPARGINDTEFAHEVVHILQHEVLLELLRKGQESKEVKEMLGVMNKLGDDALRNEIEQQKNAPIPYPTILTTVDQFFAQVYEHLIDGNAELIKKLNALPEVKEFLRDYYSKVGLPIPDALGASSPAQEKSASSAVGGIDFRSLPIVTQAMSNLSLNASRIRLSSLESINLDQELQEIQKMVEGGITPSAERIKEYVQVSCLKGKPDMQKVVSCIADILRLEEERCDHTNPTLRDILVVLESMGSAQELRQVFLGETI